MNYFKYTFRIVFSVLISSSLLVSCDALLEEEPLDAIGTEFFYKNESDALAALNAAYAQLKNGNGYYRQIWLSNVHAASDQGLSSFQHGDFIRGTISNSNPNLPPSWEQIYVAIRDANNVIARVPGIQNMDTDLQNRVVGEARFLRALHYFNLVRAFGEVPLRLQPVRLGSSEGLPLSSIQDVYAAIISDLEYAKVFCWGKEETKNGYTNNLGRVTKAAAYGLLAKVYLHIAAAKRTAIAGVEGNQRYLDFVEEPGFYYRRAKENADEAINQNGYYLVSDLDSWVELFDAKNGNNHEMLFEIQGSSAAGEGTAVSNLYSPRQAGLSGGGWGGVNRLHPRFVENHINKNDPRYINSIVTSYQDLTTKYELNTNWTGYFRTNLETGASIPTLFQIFTAKYVDTQATTEYTSQQNWHVIRLADVHLIRAEALAELYENPVLANPDINSLRQRVGMDDFNGGGMSMEEFRTALLRERAAELYMEGHRFFDLTRMGVYSEYCQITHTPAQGVRGPEDYTWPIPLSEISANSSLGGD